MKVIIVGGGKVGYYLAQTLLSHGHDPHVIEINKDQCVMLANNLDIPIICGDGSLIEVLRSAGIEGADALVGVTGKDENNLIICQLAKKKFGVRRTVARVNNPKNAKVMQQLGVDIPISSTDNIVRLLEREIDTSAIKQLAAINRGEASLSELSIPPDFKLNGIRLSELSMPVDSIVVSITRDNKLIIPRGNTQILAGDKVVVISKTEVLHDIGKILQLTQ